ncbi:rRNA-processing protein utp21 [Coemansia sp. RSA 1813]|nr:rRNA-processing protein utp21 [Coemansia sp. RSA 1646]KAJ1772208.1 rRNA-processing protein utp21 [Coemansia sp. RSA 1843]KAJ2091840.1 rRNA-processing protein utp21 [Coemansia sp. RSA 986]KAJ2215833.1 rRNA-processing protein utp21 [Coemansia sp. RSA 487]KAJ2571764.1 rRNA-processing protein utp21 [Coemansia sp. RSA 1813]
MAVQDKKARVESGATKRQAGSRLFEPYRALGYTTNGIPHSLQYRGQSIYVTTGIGRTYHVYDAEKINLLFVGPRFEADVVSVLSIGENTFVSSGGQVSVCRRGKRTHDLESANRGEITNLTQFGDQILAISEDNTIVIWDWKKGEIFTEIEFESESFQVTSLVHPSTYVNKIVVGSAQGAMQVWNIQTRRCLYEFKSFGAGISCMVQSPVIDVIAIGLLDGRILLHNVKQDRPVMQLAQEGRVTAISFRTDEIPMMASSSAEGDVALWDLNNKRLMHVLQGAHDGHIPAVDFLVGQPVLLTSSADNSIKEWIFDGHDGVPRLLRHRSGHFAAPHMIKYHDAEGKHILSAGRDRELRFFSVFRDEQNVEMSQGSLSREARTKRIRVSDLRFPQITQFDSNPAMSKDWDDVISCHQGSSDAHTWSVDRKALGKYTLQSSDDSNVRAVAISACGNYGFLGLATGTIEMINMQSGLSRRTFTGHLKAITGIQTDSCNKTVYSASLDGTLRIWDFATGKEEHCVELPSTPSRMVLHREGGLLACVCDDACVRVVDAESHRVVRKFSGHRNRITDLAFSNDGRWIVTSSLDSTIRTWDLPTGHMVDWFRVESVPVSLAFSPTGDFLATAHMDSVGIFLWANRSQFADVTLRQISAATADSEDDTASVAALIAMPTSAGLAADGQDEEGIEPSKSEGGSESGDGSADVYMSTEKLTENMVTLSSLPKSKWQTLLNLAVIKKRNAPQKPPQAPEKAPFFLPTAEGVEHRFDIGASASNASKKEDELDSPDERSRIISTASAQSGLARMLYRAEETMAYEEVFEYLKKLGPSAIDIEIRTLPLDDGLKAVKAFFKASTAQLRSKRDFELAQAYVQVFLGVFSDIIKSNVDELEPLLVELRRESKTQWATVDELVRYSACMVEYMRTSK